MKSVSIEAFLQDFRWPSSVPPIADAIHPIPTTDFIGAGCGKGIPERPACPQTSQHRNPVWTLSLAGDSFIRP